ncbi:MAG: VWA domain-containing protein [Bacteroidetes bacterium]|nr:VWA domain-containing protein [Bacteroidota bacterium]
MASLVLPLQAQNSGIGVDQAHKDIGTVENIYKIHADYVLENHLAKNLYLMRGDADKGLTIHTSKKTLKPGDTALITIEFIPESTGKFSKSIKLITSADGAPFVLNLSGTIKSIKTDDKTACYYFGKPNKAGVKTDMPLAIVTDSKPRDQSNKIPDHSTPSAATETPVPHTTEPVKPKDETMLDASLYKPNNIVFVVDVSNSMKDSLKLPVMQSSLHHLIDALRPTDRVTFITYADSVKLLKDNISGSQKKELHDMVDRLKAKGLTKGNKAILYGLDVAVKNYIEGGNNQIILATDGKFRFYSEDQQKFKDKQHDKQVVLSTVAFGNDKEAMDNLKDIARIGKGDFIHIKSRAKSQEALLDEIKEKSLIR